MFISQLQPPERFSPRRLAFSALLHATLLLLALSLRFTPAVPFSPAPARSVLLLAPAKIKPPVPHVHRAPIPLPPSPSSQPRAFTAPLPSASPAARIATVQIALPEQSPAPAPPVELPQTQSALPPPPVILGKLSSVSATTPTAATVGPLHAGAFAASANSTAEPEPPRTTRSSGFGDVSTVASLLPKSRSSAPPITAVEILSKPRPLYTEEARQLHIEGEVLLEVLFLASGSARVERILRGLGHGLDEAAIMSATQIQFRPALRAGRPVDQAATVHITFQLAY